MPRDITRVTQRRGNRSVWKVCVVTSLDRMSVREYVLLLRRPTCIWEECMVKTGGKMLLEVMYDLRWSPYNRRIVSKF
jgi:hypothetical protein